LAALWLAQSGVSAQREVPPTLPRDLQVPHSEKLILQAHGVGQQIYTCKAVEGNYAWVLKGPDAKLLDANGRVSGRHFVGPTWEATDGSRVMGKAVASVPASDSHSVSWLRLEAISHEGKGAMSEVVSIQRLNTKGGKPMENGCDISSAGAEARVPYEADYYFYDKKRE
jgi:hypothetical protein